MARLSKASCTCSTVEDLLVNVSKNGLSTDASNATPTSSSISANDLRRSSSMELSTSSSVKPSAVNISLYASPSFANWGSSWRAICSTEDDRVGVIEISVAFSPSISPSVSAICCFNSSKPMSLFGSNESAIRFSSSEREARSSREILPNFSSSRSFVLSYVPLIFWILVTIFTEP